MRVFGVLLLGLASACYASGQAVLFENLDRNRFEAGQSVAMGGAQPTVLDFANSDASLGFNNLCSSVEVSGGTVEIFRDQFSGFLNLFSAPPGRGFTANLQPSSNDQTSSAFSQPAGRRRKLRRSLLLSREDMERIFGKLLGDGGSSSPPGQAGLEQYNSGVTHPSGSQLHYPRADQSHDPPLPGPSASDHDHYYDAKPKPSGGGFYGSHDTEPKIILYDSRPVDYDDSARGHQWESREAFRGDLSSQYFENRASAMLLCGASVVGYEDNGLSTELFQVEAARGTCVDIVFDESTENRLSALNFQPCKDHYQHPQTGHPHQAPSYYSPRPDYNPQSDRC